ncbi:ATP-dependent RNA helicase mtr4 [Phlyctochytrium bullatum]|nr:ATP-dependent RNA helicase mtr4 [Phlyctochytrium bullatum]
MFQEEDDEDLPTIVFPTKSTAVEVERNDGDDDDDRGDAMDEDGNDLGIEIDKGGKRYRLTSDGDLILLESAPPPPKMEVDDTLRDSVLPKPSVKHEVAVPPAYSYIPLKDHRPPDAPARKFPFTLDPFQEMAIAAVERNESVLVSAHTSAGKTALSNQKYRDFQMEFGDVGLLTGDVTIKPKAQCLVMTTEILRAMLYRKSDVVQDASWIIFDEVHYLRDRGNDIFTLVKSFVSKGFQPLIVFSFSRRECETYALDICRLGLNNDNEAARVKSIFENAVITIGEEDRALPQVQSLLPLLQRGIGVHHSGLLPLVREVVEVLFQEGLVKVLFATETFSIGLNMPARTVVFTSLQKYDGERRRYITAGEYIQMSGRAGRRGLDKSGTVVVMVDAGLDGENIATVMQDLADFQKKLDDYKIDNMDEIAEIHKLLEELSSCQQDVRDVLNHEAYCLPFLQPGRLVWIRDAPRSTMDKSMASHSVTDYGWGIVVNLQRRVLGKNESPARDPNTPNYLIDVLLCCDIDSSTGKKDVRPCPIDSNRGEMAVIPCALFTIEAISAVKFHVPKDLRLAENRHDIRKSIKEILKKYGEGIPLLDPIRDIGIKDEKFRKLLKTIAKTEGKLKEMPLRQSPEFETLYRNYKERNQVMQEYRRIKKAAKEAENIIDSDNLKHRLKMLRRLGYISSSDKLRTRGRVACEITTADEIVLTEMLYDGVFEKLTVDQSVVLLSCFCCDEKVDRDRGSLPDDLAALLKKVKSAAKKVTKAFVEYKIPIDEGLYLDSFREDLMEAALEWCNGASFAKICKLMDTYEGGIVRSFHKLEELLRQLIESASCMQNDALVKKFSEAKTKIKRDIAFAASLYL